MSQILFILSGSIACYKACDAISQLVQRGHTVRAVATEAALRFVGTATLEGLTRQKVGRDLFEEGAALDHITLARWADVTVVCPATANTLNRMAAGLGDDLAGALLLAHDWTTPLVIAPAMNPAMWRHPATVASVARLREWGARTVEVGSGRTACGEMGEGRMAEPEAIVEAIEAALARPVRRLRVLITSGGTSEPIDGVRVLTNTSTGETGALVADHFFRAGHEVHLLRARHARRPLSPCAEEVFDTHAQLDAALSHALGDEAFDVVIHAAAVGDFSVQAIEVDGRVAAPRGEKLRSDVDPVLRLKRNPKLLDTLRTRSRNASIQVVAFKLTHGADVDETRAAVQSLFVKGAADWVVHNDLLLRASSTGDFPADIWNAHGAIVESCANRAALAVALEKIVSAAVAGETTAGESATGEPIAS